MSADNEQDLTAWDGWVHSRIRTLVKDLQDSVAPRTWPEGFRNPEPRVADGRSRLFYYIACGKLKRAVLRVDKANGVVLEPEQLGRQGVACGKPNITGSVRNWKCTVSHQHGGGFGQARESSARGRVWTST